MNQTEFDTLSADLRKLSAVIPLHWGAVQNNRTDDLTDMFSIHSYENLETAISRLSDERKNYIRRRWYLWKCSECDEYLFYKHENVEKNPNRYDKEWDVCINNQFKFDIKGTVIPQAMRSDIDVSDSTFALWIDFYYKRQSKGRRYDIQNRLFIVHHSLVDPQREFYLRCAWQSKDKIYSHFISHIDEVKLFEYEGCQATVVFLIEETRNVVSAFVPGLGKIL